MTAPTDPPPGIVCPRCGGTDWETRRTQRVPYQVRRYKRCRGCGHHLTTYETAPARIRRIES